MKPQQRKTPNSATENTRQQKKPMRQRQTPSAQQHKTPGDKKHQKRQGKTPGNIKHQKGNKKHPTQRISMMFGGHRHGFVPSLTSLWPAGGVCSFQSKRRQHTDQAWDSLHATSLPFLPLLPRCASPLYPSPAVCAMLAHVAEVQPETRTFRRPKVLVR